MGVGASVFRNGFESAGYGLNTVHGERELSSTKREGSKSSARALWTKARRKEYWLKMMKRCSASPGQARNSRIWGARTSWRASWRLEMMMLGVSTEDVKEELSGLSEVRRVCCVSGDVDDVDDVDVVVVELDELSWDVACSSVGVGRVGSSAGFRGLPFNNFVPVLHHVIT